MAFSLVLMANEFHIFAICGCGPVIHEYAGNSVMQYFSLFKKCTVYVVLDSVIIYY